MDLERPASPEETKDHLEAFVKAFVDPARRERWRKFMLERPDRAARELHRLQLDDRHATWLDRKARGSSALLDSLKDKVGIYFTFSAEPVWKRVQDAALESDWKGADAIFSVLPGKLAIYFNHDHVTVVLQAE